MNKDDGGPAFPVVAEQYNYGHERAMPHCVEPGMTLRDYFAAKALQALITASPHMDGLETSDGSPLDERAFSKQAYELADAMLKARQA